MQWIKRIVYLMWWQLRAWFGKRAPLQSVIFILDKCNLRCKHCSVYAISKPRIKPLQDIREELEDCYRAGSRFVDFEGGELYLWRDGAKTIDDVIDLAHSIGFWSATITTNAQLPFSSSHADHIWVSMDGIGQWHNSIRGIGTFERLEKNIQQSNLPVSVNMVLNNINYEALVPTLEYVKNNPHIKQISFNFHTPFSTTEDLQLQEDIRNKLIDTIIEYKHRGYPIMNSYSGLKLMRSKDGKTVCGNESCWITNFIFSDGSRCPKCMGYKFNVCDKCGFSMGGEMNAMMHLKPDTLLAGLRLRMQ